MIKMDLTGKSEKHQPTNPKIKKPNKTLPSFKEENFWSILTAITTLNDKIAFYSLEKGKFNNTAEHIFTH